MRRFLIVPLALLLIAAALGSPRSSGVSAASRWDSAPLKKTCHTVTKKVHGKKKRVKVCHAAHAPTPTATPTTPDFKNLFGIAVDGQGYVYVSNYQARRLEKFAPDGTFLTDIGDGALGNMPEGDPHCGTEGVAIGPQGTIYLTAFCAKAVVTLSPSGQILHRYPSNQDGYDWVAVDGKGNIDVPNSRDGTLEQFAPDAPHPSILHRFDANDPWGVAVDRDGNIYVALSGTDVIVKLSPTGAELSRSAPLEGGPQKTEVDAIVVDSHGTVYAAIGASRSQLDTEIIKLSPDWQDLGVVASSGTGPGQVQGVGGMAVDAQDNLYVVDGGNNRIEKFSPSDQLLATWPHT